MKNLSLDTGSKSKSELLELKNLHENIKNLIEKDFVHVSDLYDCGLFTMVNDMEKLIEHDLEILEDNGY